MACDHKDFLANRLHVDANTLIHAFLSRFVCVEPSLKSMIYSPSLGAR